MLSSRPYVQSPLVELHPDVGKIGDGACFLLFLLGVRMAIY